MAMTQNIYIQSNEREKNIEQETQQQTDMATGEIQPEILTW